MSRLHFIWCFLLTTGFVFTRHASLSIRIHCQTAEMVKHLIEEVKSIGHLFIAHRSIFTVSLFPKFGKVQGKPRQGPPDHQA